MGMRSKRSKGVHFFESVLHVGHSNEGALGLLHGIQPTIDSMTGFKDAREGARPYFFNLNKIFSVTALFGRRICTAQGRKLS